MTNENKKDVNFKGSITAKSRVEITDDNYIRKFFKIIYEEGDIIEFGLFNDELGLKAKRLWATRVAGRKVIANVTIDKIEIDLGVPVLTSNTATLWAMMIRAGAKSKLEGYGRLLLQ